MNTTLALRIGLLTFVAVAIAGAVWQQNSSAAQLRACDSSTVDSYMVTIHMDNHRLDGTLLESGRVDTRFLGNETQSFSCWEGELLSETRTVGDAIYSKAPSEDWTAAAFPADRDRNSLVAFPSAKRGAMSRSIQRDLHQR